MRRPAGACPSLASRCRPLLLSFQHFASFDGIAGHPTKIDTIAQALRAVGKCLEVSVT